MAQVDLEINGRLHTVGCGDGEEPRLRALARYVDAKLRDLMSRVGPLGEARLLLLTCLTLADELGEAYQQARATRPADGDPSAAVQGEDPRVDAMRADLAALEARIVAREAALAGDLARMAARLEKASEDLLAAD